VDTLTYQETPVRREARPVLRFRFIPEADTMTPPIDSLDPVSVGIVDAANASISVEALSIAGCVSLGTAADRPSIVSRRRRDAASSHRHAPPHGH
jgi:hypothetical protein